MKNMVEKLIDVLLVILLIAAIAAVATGLIVLLMIGANLLLGTKLPWVV